MSVYVVAAVTPKDPELYAEYERLAMQSAVEFGIVPIITNDNPRQIEGTFPGQRIVVLKFPSEDVMNAWYDSETYKRAREIRADAADTAFLLSVPELILLNQ